MERTAINPEEFISLLADSKTEKLENYIVHNAKFNGITIKIKKQLINCEFINCQHDRFSLSNDLFFLNCTFECEHGLEFKNIHQISTLSSIDFDMDCVFRSSVLFKYTDINRLKLSGIFTEKLSFDSCSLESLSISATKEKRNEINNIIFTKSSGIKSFLIRDSNISGDISFHIAAPSRITICNGNYRGINFHSIWNVQYLKIENDDWDQNALSIQHLNMPYLTLEGQILIKNVTIQDVTFHQFINKGGDFRLYKVKFNGKFLADESDFGDVLFSDIDFQNANLILDRTNLNDTSFSNITWPRHHFVGSEIPVDSLENKIIHYKIKTEVYRQLKKVSLSGSNNVEANKFYRNEMATYWQRVKLDKSERRWDRFLIRINKWGSNFGQNYMQAFALLLLIHLIGCFIIWFCEAGFDFKLGYTNFKNFQEGVKEYVTWIIPVYKLPDFDSSTALLVSALWRLIDGYLIFHFIKASRKFGKV